MALAILINIITQAMEKSEYVLGVFLDFSKAFDTVDYNILMQKCIWWRLNKRSRDDNISAKLHLHIFLYNVGPTSSTLNQHCINVIQMFCAYWVFCKTQWRKPFWMGTRWKQSYVRPPPSYFIVFASSVTTMEVKAIEFHRMPTVDII